MEQIRELEGQKEILLRQRRHLQMNLDVFKEKARERAEEKQKRREKLESRPS